MIQNDLRDNLPPKLAGGFILDCGHQQVVSEHRQRLASAGYEQVKVWCEDCSAWTRLAPLEVEELPTE